MSSYNAFFDDLDDLDDLDDAPAPAPPPPPMIFSVKRPPMTTTSQSNAMQNRGYTTMQNRPPLHNLAPPMSHRPPLQNRPPNRLVPQGSLMSMVPLKFVHATQVSPNTGPYAEAPPLLKFEFTDWDTFEDGKEKFFEIDGTSFRRQHLLGEPGKDARTYQIEGDSGEFAMRIEIADNSTNTRTRLENAQRLSYFIGKLDVGAPVRGVGLLQTTNKLVSIMIMEKGEDIERICDFLDLTPRELEKCRVDLTLQVHDLLAKLMAAGIFCSDIKPENTVVRKPFKVMLIDFGPDACFTFGEPLPVQLQQILISLMTLQYAALVGVRAPKSVPILTEMCSLITSPAGQAVLYAHSDTPTIAAALYMAGHYFKTPNIATILQQLCDR